MPGLVNGWYDDKVVKVGVPLMTELIREIRHEVDKQQSELLVMFIPSPLMVYLDTYGPILKSTFPDHPNVDKFLQDSARPQKFFLKICKDLGIACIDLYPIFLRNNSEGLYFPREGHLTEVGHSIVAAALAERIESFFDR